MLQAYLQKELIEAGVDEAGRGCLAGPVVAAAVILPTDYFLEGLNDSKQVSEEKREQMATVIQSEAIAWAVGVASVEEIDDINILKASMLAMHRAIEQLTTVPGLLLIDGNRFAPYLGIPHVCLVKGDARFLSIAAASILAKTHRDQLMLSLSQQYPAYGWSNNKGYPTLSHRQAIREHGLTPWHRLTFRHLPEGEEVPVFE